MKRNRFITSILSLIIFNSQALAAAPEYHSTYLQVIQLINFLANTGIANAGMTPTAMTVQFYDDNSGKACWTTSLSYQGDFTLRSGPGQSCPNLVDHIVVTPIAVATLLQTYSGPYTINIDTTKYSSQITILQNAAPVFDTASGLVATPGTIKTEIQDQYR